MGEARGEGRRGRRPRSRGLPARAGWVRSLARFLAWLVLAMGLTWGVLAVLDAWIS